MFLIGLSMVSLGISLGTSRKLQTSGKFPETIGMSGKLPSSPENPYVTCTFDVNKKNFRPGAKGELLVTLQPIKGIHINLEPAMSVRFDSSSGLQSNGAMGIPRKENYFDAGKKIHIPFVLSAASAPGTATLKATLTYYYCSDAEGWCSRFRQPLEISMTVTK